MQSQLVKGIPPFFSLFYHSVILVIFAYDLRNVTIICTTEDCILKTGMF